MQNANFEPDEAFFESLAGDEPGSDDFVRRNIDKVEPGYHDMCEAPEVTIETVHAFLNFLCDKAGITRQELNRHIDREDILGAYRVVFPTPAKPAKKARKVQR